MYKGKQMRCQKVKYTEQIKVETLNRGNKYKKKTVIISFKRGVVKKGKIEKQQNDIQKINKIKFLLTSKISTKAKRIESKCQYSSLKSYLFSTPGGFL